MVDRLCESAVDTGRELIEASRNDNRWRTVAKQMVQAWNEGMASLRSVKSETQFKGLTTVIAAAGFSDQTPPESPPAVGRSELLARPRKAKKRRRAQ
jgi:serine/threonine-protein kinase HipA